MTDLDPSSPDALMDDLTAHVDYVESHVVDLDRLLEKYPVEALDLAHALEARSILNTTAEGLRGIRERLDDLIGDAMGEYRTVVEGHGQIERHRKKARTQWDRDALLRDVKDSRLTDKDGVVVDETPLEKVLAVFNLPAPRTTALKARHLDPDDYCHVEERPGWSIRQF